MLQDRTSALVPNPHQISGRYDLCLHLVTAAHGAEQFYTLEQAEGVSVRSESPQQARDLDDKMK